jgi:hypothetical protein
VQYFEHLFPQGGARLPLRERELIAVVVSAQKRFKSFRGAQPPRKLRWTNAGR